jgi:hypothetical protein
MLRRLYSWIIRLHPRRFRDRFAQEMLSIFDESKPDQGTARLLADGAVSLVRQWALRSGPGVAETRQAVPWSTDGTPVFYVFQHYKPRTSSLITGGMLTLVVFCAAWLVCEYAWTHPMFMPLVTVQSEPGPDLKTTGQSGPSPLPLQATATSSNEMISARSGPKRVPNSSEPTPAPLGNPPVSQPTVSAQFANAQPSAVLPANAATVTSSSVQPARNLGVAPTIPKPAILSCIGVYKTDMPNPLIIAVTAEQAGLAIQIPGGPGTRLAPLGGTDFIFSDSRNDFVEFMARGHAPAHELVIYRNGRRMTAHRVGTPYR